MHGNNSNRSRLPGMLVLWGTILKKDKLNVVAPKALQQLQFDLKLLKEISVSVLVGCCALIVSGCGDAETDSSNPMSKHAQASLEEVVVPATNYARNLEIHVYKYEPQDRCELEHLLANNNVRLDEINTKHIKDFSLLFASPEAVGQFMMSKAAGKAQGMSPELIASLDKFQKCAGYDRRGDYAGLEYWDTSAAENMLGMFWGAENFDHPIADWNTSKVKTMERMFYGAAYFNQDLGKWNTAQVTSMKEMFAGARNFNQPLNTWNTANVTRMDGMFNGDRDFNQPLNKWNTAKVTTMESMFKQASSFNQDLNTWQTTNVTNMNQMFLMAVAFQGAIGAWDTSKVTTMVSMFEKAVSFNQPLTKWQTGSVVSMEGMFKDASSFNQDLKSFDTGKVTDMNEMFNRAKSFNQDLNSWHVANVISMDGIFAGASSLKELPKWYQERQKAN